MQFLWFSSVIALFSIPEWSVAKYFALLTGEQDGVVGSCCHIRSGNKHKKSSARELKGSAYVQCAQFVVKT